MKEGEYVTLQTGFTEIQIYDFITWMFGETVIAEIYKAAQLSCIYDSDDERFRDRLQLANQTGSLTITKCNTSNSGLYELKINRHTVHQRFILTVSRSKLKRFFNCLLVSLRIVMQITEIFVQIPLLLLKYCYINISMLILQTNHFFNKKI